MKAILSCDDNPFYLDFWPLVKDVWKNHLDIDPFLIRISDEVGEEEDVHYVKPIAGVPIYLQAQLARIYFTQLFDDEICVCYKEGFDWIEERYKATTDPSMEQHKDPDNPKGVAILKPGQYRGVYKIDKHAGKYYALCQRGAEVTVYRDNNLNERTDYINEESGYFGINLHRAHPNKIVQSTRAYSHGCQVIQNPADFTRLMGLARLQIGIGYDSFTYTLIEATEEELD